MTFCKVLIKIDKENLIKYKSNKLEDIKYTITSKEKEHSCIKNKQEKKNNISEFIKNEPNKDNYREIVKSLIIMNITKHLSFHIENLKKYLQQSLREKDYTSNDKYLRDISTIKISLDDKIELSNIPFCYKYVNLINTAKGNKLEKYIIFTSSFQLKIIQHCTQMYIDGTFKSCPKTFYPIINLAGYYHQIEGIIPIFMIPTTSKSGYIYDKIFKEILFDNKIF